MEVKITKDFLDDISVRSTLGLLNDFKMSGFDMKYDWDKVKHDMSFLIKCSVPVLEKNAVNYRIKSLDSILLKIKKYMSTNKSARICFNDLINIRYIIDSYSDFELPVHAQSVDFRNGKKIDDGYRGMHFYYVRDKKSYPIELQVWEKRDEIFNNWTHKYCYKFESGKIPANLRKLYEHGTIMSESEFIAELQRLRSVS